MTTTTFRALVADGCLEFNDGYRTRRSELSSSGYRILRAADVQNGGVIIDGPDFVGVAQRERIGPKMARDGDVVLTTKGTVGRVAIMSAPDEEVVYSPQLCYFRILEAQRLVHGYLRYWFSSEEFRHQASYLMSNTDMAPYLSLRDLASLTITLPELEEQRAVADVLGAIDDKIAVNTAVARTADELAAAIFHAAVDGHERCEFLAVVTPMLGGTPDRQVAEYWAPGHRWASARDVTSAPIGVLLTTGETISQAAVDQTRVRPHPPGTVVLTARGTVGAVARLAEPAAINQSCYAFRSDHLGAALLYLTVKGAVSRAQAMAHGSVFSTITMRTFQHLQVPKLDSQLESLREQVDPLLGLVESKVRENALLTQLRDTLLPALMSGQLTVRQAEQVAEAAL